MARPPSEEPPMTWRVEAGTLVPANDKARSWMVKAKPGDLVNVDAIRKRSLKHHNKYWKLLSIVAENSETFTAPRQVHMAIKATLCHGKWITVHPKSPPIFCEDPTNFGSMDQEAFSAFYSAAVNVVLKYLMPGVDPDTLDRLAMEF